MEKIKVDAFLKLFIQRSETMLTICEFLTTSPELAKEYTKRISFQNNEIIHRYDYVKNNQFILIEKGVGKLEFYRKRRWEFETFITEDEFAGVENLLNAKKYSCSMKYRVVGASEGSALLVNKDFFLDHMYADPLIFHAVLEHVALRHILTSHNFREKKSPLKQRVADLLLEFTILTTLPTINNQIVFPDYFSESMLTSVLRAPSDNVIAILVFLEEQQIIIREPVFTIINPARLKRLSNLDLELFEDTTELVF
ncbi:hypothetical protein [Listeria grandensis]|uniref:hypothetical protein n=1 Tax=Listeria grandensis TaxID=1494963 RepID=UPI00164D394B|nr:hypothetical protein [Listeria grandensis]MBC6314428.1 hypothetical protein [Listeria grandensis]